MRSAKHIIAHAICLSLGVALGLIFLSPHRSDAHQMSESSQAKLPTTGRRIEKTEDRIDKIIQKEQRHRSLITERTVRQFALVCLEKIPAFRAENENQFSQWMLEAKSMDENVDLATALTEALAIEDESQIGRLMVAWFARDPSDAFRQFSLRPGLLLQLSVRSPLWHALDSANVQTFLQKPSISKSVRKAIIQNYTIRLADYGRMEEFLTFHASLKRDDANEAIRIFTEAWLPLEPESSAAVIHRNLESPSVALLLEAMLEGVPNPKPLWTDDFGKALLSKSLGPLESQRNAITGELDRIDNPLGDDFYFTRDDATVLERASIPQSMDEVIRIHLSHDRDWLEPFTQQKCSIEEIEVMLRSRIPEASDHLVALHQGMVRALWIHQPTQITSWARDHMSEEELASCLSEVIANLTEHRASRMHLMLDSLEGIKFTDEKAVKWIELSRASVDRWLKNLEPIKEQ